MTKKLATLGVFDKLFIGLLLVIFGGIVLHAPLTIWVGTFLPDADILIKSWKEILMGVATIVGTFIIWRKKRWDIVKNPLVLLIAGYALLHIALLPLFDQNPTSAVAGLLIDLRYLLFFVLVFAAICLYPTMRRVFIAVFVAGALVVGIFALLQVFILPPDILSLIGYGDATISPYLTVDDNPDYVRINSTLRGPNPLGAYAVIMLALAGAYVLRGRIAKNAKRPVVVVGIILLTGLVALWASYSRSALIAAFAALAVVLLLTVGRKISRWMWVMIIVIIFAVGGALFAARNTSFVSNVILHENEGTGATISSNDGHAESLIDGLDRMVRQPLGGGVGSTGSASLYGNEPLIIENQYLFIAHEVGWFGLAIFLAIFVKVLLLLWRRRSDWLALGLLASGIGLALIGMLLPVWVDDTVSIVWWGLAAIVIASSYRKSML